MNYRCHLAHESTESSVDIQISSFVSFQQNAKITKLTKGLDICRWGTPMVTNKIHLWVQMLNWSFFWFFSLVWRSEGLIIMWHCFTARTHCLIHLQRSCVPPTCKLCMPWLCFKTQSLEEGSSPQPVALAFCGGKLPVKCKGESSDSELRHGIFCKRMWIRNLHQKVSSAIECEPGICLDRYLLQQNMNQRIWTESLLPQNCTICLQSLGSTNMLKRYVCREKQVCTWDDIKAKRFHISLTSLPHCQLDSLYLVTYSSLLPSTLIKNDCSNR